MEIREDERENVRAFHAELGMQLVRYAKEELERRKKAPVLVKGRDIAKDFAVTNHVWIFDPRIGSNNRTHRLWVSRLPVGDEEGRRWRTLGHRHTVEAIIYHIQGRGHSIIDGQRHDWEAGDLLSVPMFAWHRHINDGDEDVIRFASTTGPLSMAIGQAVYEDELHPEYWVFAQQGEDLMKTLIPGGAGDLSVATKAQNRAAQLYGEELAFAMKEERLRRESKVLAKGSEIKFELTPMGRLAYLVDPRLGFYQKVMAATLLEVSPHHRSGAHRHLYDEIGYVVSGQGKAVIDDREYELEPGDALCLPPFTWHQFFNTGSQPLRIVMPNTRVGMENLGLCLTQQGEASDEE